MKDKGSLRMLAAQDSKLTSCSRQEAKVSQ